MSVVRIEPIPYRKRDQQRDLRVGLRDGRKLLPAYSDLVKKAGQGDEATAPYPERLRREGLYQMDNELVAFRRNTSELSGRVVRLRAALQVAQEEVRRAEAGLEAARAELTPAELLPRNPQEAAGRDEAAVLSRRNLMRERRIALAQAELDRRIGAADEMRAGIAQACGEIEREFAATQARARRLADYFTVRVATYWEGVALAHAEGRHMALVRPVIAPLLPDWIDASCRCGSLEAR